MPEFFAQGEVGARGRRDIRCDSQRQADLAAKRGTRSRGNENCNSENSYVPFGGDSKGRRSPRLSAFATANKGYGNARGLSDITNVAACRSSNVDRFKPFKPPQKQQQQQQQSSFQPASASTRKAPAPAPAPTSDVLAEDKALSDPQSVKEYAADIVDQFFQAETKALPKADYMNSQVDITGKMRMILIDWLIEVHLKYRLRSETLHLTVNLVDRYLSKKQVNKKRLQLVGVVAMFIATKFEEISPPELHDWVYITDNAYTKNDVLLMECDMLSALNFQIVVPTAAHFFDHLVVANGCDARHCSCTQYLLELGLLDIRMLHYKPSQIVAAVLLLSNELLRRNAVWTETMVQQSRQTEQSLRPCAEALRQLWKADRAGSGGQLQAVHKKFSMAQYQSVATSNF